MIKRLLISLIFLPLLFILLNSCVNKKLPETDQEANQYLPIVEEFCTDKNLELNGYLGKTILRGKDFKNSDIGKEPIVYEWQVTNNASKKKFVIWVGPIMPQYKNLKPLIQLGRERYTLQGTKVVDYSGNEEPKQDKK